MTKKVLVVCFLSFFAIYSLLIALSFDVGRLGELIGDLLFRFLGVGTYIFPFFLGYLAYEIYHFQPARKFRIIGRIISFSLWIVIFLTLSQRAAERVDFSLSGGEFAGIAGVFLYQHLTYYLGDTGCLLVLFFAAFLAVYLGGEGKLLRQISQGWRFLKSKVGEAFSRIRRVPKEKAATVMVTSRTVVKREKKSHPEVYQESLLDEIFNPVELETEEKLAASRGFSTPRRKKRNTASDWALPSPQLLKVYPPRGEEKTRKEIMEEVDKLEQTLAEFNVLGKVVNVQVGPTITRFDFQPAPGVKVQKIISLSNDLALAFAVAAVRIEAPIPGRSAVGIEVPNRHKEIVSLRELVENEEFQKSGSPLTVALGRDVSGRPIIWDLREAPHLLIAGATGSGKSVCINSILASLLYRATPNDLRIGLIDPKRVELSLYAGLPHLCAPVISDIRWVVRFLKWLCREMDTRYELLSEVSARNVEEYNQAVEEEEKLPYVVIVIDELADLMMTAPGEVESCLCRLAQIARAVGMHLVVATQRPSVDVITGLIKANFPSRLAFAVSSQVDSRTILDSPGAEKLLGNGDLLFAPLGVSKPIRGQGAFISTSETKNLVEYWLSQKGEIYYPLEYIPREEKGEEEGDDELYQEAVRLVIESGKASASLLQRRLRVGFNRAARLIEQMEREGIVGPYEGSKPRKVIVSRGEEMK